MKKRGCKKWTIVRIKITPNLRAFFLVNDPPTAQVARVEARVAVAVTAEEVVAAVNRCRRLRTWLQTSRVYCCDRKKVCEHGRDRRNHLRRRRLLRRHKMWQ